jgi:CPA1 family monovalent cation:H+ antiporter
MTIFQLLGLVTTVIALFGYINHRFIKLPDTLGITAVGLVVSTALVLLGHHEPRAVHWAQELVSSIDFSEVVFHGMLPLLLFAGSLHVNVAEIAKEKAPILVLASAGVAISTAVVGFGMYYGLAAVGMPLELVYCLLFGALISPTDPIAVMSVLKKVGVSKSLETKISGESLFNDGTGVVAYLLLLGVAAHTAEPTMANIGLMLVKEVAGAVVLGLIVGYGAVLMLRGVDSYPVEILITLALATAGYALAETVHVSAPLAVVIMGLVMGNLGAAKAMSEQTKAHLFGFWELLDELLNLMLFGLIGLQVLALDVAVHHLWVGAMAIVVVLFARWVSVAIPLAALSPFRSFAPHAVKILTWGGLRGGISIALALSLPKFEGRDLLISATYVVVLFSLLVQATSLSKLLRRLSASPQAAAVTPAAKPVVDDLDLDMAA